MTAFHATKLPLDPKVYAAYLIYQSRFQAQTLEDRESKYNLLSVTELLVGQGVTDPNIFIATLLFDIDEAAYPLLEKRFGSEVIELIKDVKLHRDDEFNEFWLVEQNVLTINFALKVNELWALGHGVRLDLLKDKSYKQGIIEDLQEYQAYIAKWEQWLENPRPALYLTSALNSVHELISSGYQPAPLVLMLDKHDFAEIFYPSFEDAQLPPFPEVRVAYELITSDAKVAKDDFDFALRVVQTLHIFSETHTPEMLAAAMIDICLRERRFENVADIQEKIGQNSMALIAGRSLYGLTSAADVLSAPAEFQQMAVAQAIVKLDDAVIVLEEGIDKTIKGVISREILLQTVVKIDHYLQGIEVVYRPVIKELEAPKLVEVFDLHVKKLFLTMRSATEAHFKPNSPSAVPSSKPPRPTGY